MSFWTACVYGHCIVLVAHRGQKRALDPFELQLWMLANNHVLLGIKPRLSARMHALNNSVIFQSFKDIWKRQTNNFIIFIHPWTNAYILLLCTILSKWYKKGMCKKENNCNFLILVKLNEKWYNSMLIWNQVTELLQLLGAT